MTVRYTFLAIVLLTQFWGGPRVFKQAVAADESQVRVAVYTDSGASRSVKALLQLLNENPALQVEKITARQIQSEKLQSFDVLIQPGGSGGKQGRTLETTDRDAVRTFVRDGGGYVGFCAGAYLASCDYDWSLHILDAKVLDKKHWARGFGKTQVRVEGNGRPVLEVNETETTIYYHQGPLLAPADDPDVDDYESWGTFQTEIAKKGAPAGVMIGTTAIAAGTFGQGRVLCFSPHPRRPQVSNDLSNAVCYGQRAANRNQI